VTIFKQCYTWTVQECTFSVFEKEVKRILGSQTEEVIEGLIKLHDVELCNLLS
jgi:hypothetical protein